MMVVETLSNLDGELKINLHDGKWIWQLKEDGGFVESNCLCQVFGNGGPVIWPLKPTKPWIVLERDKIIEIPGIGTCTAISILGEIPTTISSPNFQNQQQIQITFILQGNILLWKTKLQGLVRDAYIDSIQVFEGKWTPSRQYDNSWVHINGWQSWSYTGSIKCGKGVKEPDIAMPKFLSAGFHNRQRGSLGKRYRKIFENKSCFESDMFAVTGIGNHKNESSYPMVTENLVWGFLSQKQQFGTIRLDSETGGCKKATINCEGDGVLLPASGSMETDWTCLIYHRHSFVTQNWGNWNDYIHIVGIFNEARIHADNPLTWCSWYHFGPNINAKILKEQIKLAGKKSFQLFLIDDGWSPSWGDWDFKQEEEEHELCEQIKTNGMIPGLWMAPFAADRNSKIGRMRPDLILRNNPTKKYSFSCNSGFPAKFFYGLDATHPDALYHAEKSIQNRAQLFPFLKLDFLYASVLRDYTGTNHANNRFNPTLTRAQALNLAMKAMRSGAGNNTFLLGCGCPLGSAIGYMDGMRLGTDVGPGWFPKFPAPYWDKTNIPCMRNSVRDVLARSPTNGKWWVGDPDCILLSHSGLSHDEVIGIATIAAVLGGSVSVSDDLASLPNSKLEIAKKVFPSLKAPFDCLDIMTSEIPSLFRLNLNDQGALLVVCCNWSEKSKVDLRIEKSRLLSSTYVESSYLVFEYWTSEIKEVVFDEFVEFDLIPKHSARILSFLPQVKVPQYIGSDIHFARNELVFWEFSENKLRFEIKTFRNSGETNRIWISIPKEICVLSVTDAHGQTSNCKLQTSSPHESCIIIEIHINDSGYVEILFDDANNILIV